MDQLKEQVNNIKTQLVICEAELASLMSGKKASGPRVRACLMKIKGSAHAARSATTAVVAAIPTKSRAKSPAEEPVAAVVAEVVAEPKVAKAKRVRKAAAVDPIAV